MDSHENMTGVREGDVLAGRYRIDKILGQGGMGVVVAAHHIHLDDKVAIKFLLPQAMGSPEAVARFAREARAAVKIKNEHVARVTDVGTLDTGAPYMVMEYLEGGDLSQWLQQSGPLPVEQAVDFVLQACEAVAEAHSLGIVHRDLKPANLFVIRRPDGALSVKVLDFGISKVARGGSSAPDVSITKTAAVMGSPLYMSPEQMRSSKDVDARADIWALGVILYELASGASPFSGDTMPELVARILAEPPAPLVQNHAGIPAGLEAVILRCLEKERDRRYESVGQLAVELLPFGSKRARLSVDRISGVLRASGLSASALALPPSSDPSEHPRGGSTEASWGRTDSAGGPKRSLALAVTALVLLAVVGIVGWRATRVEAQPGPASSVAAEPVSAPVSAPIAPVPSKAPAPSEPTASPEPTSSALPEPSHTTVAASPAKKTLAVPVVRPERQATRAPRPAPTQPKPTPPTGAKPAATKPKPKPKPSNPFDDRK